ncbi:hypothetical protein FRC03_010273 [Tulasnella sp. 419]|nr:hypothetical protein FRC03_010273 [Tulasnella sp. 419]
MSLEQYIADHALHFFGLSDDSLVAYVKAAATSAKTPEGLFQTLTSNGLPATAEAQHFVTQVYSLAPRKTKHKLKSGSDSHKKAEKEAKDLRSQKFGLLLDDDYDAGVVEVKSSKSKGKEKEKNGGNVDKDRSKDKKERHTRKREADEKNWESDEDEKLAKRRKTDDEYDVGLLSLETIAPYIDHVIHRTQQDPPDRRMDEPEDEVPDEDPDERRERERLKDLKERDAFAERIKERDKERTKKVVEDRSSKKSGAAAEAAERRRLADDSVARASAMPDLRTRSRQQYLTKRELQQIELLRQEIADDEALFSGMKITKREQKELERKKEVLRLAEERMRIDDKYDGYMLPEDYITEQGKIDRKKKESVLYQRYEEQKTGENFVTDVDQWEQSQTKNSTFKSGALDKEALVDDYDYVFDESQTIKFVMENRMNAGLSAKEAELNAMIEAAEKRAQSIDDTRKSLPIYQYREELLEAISKHQVLIVVAETGSGKTTQLPQYLHEAGYTANGQKVGCTQPRRVAAMSVAARVAEEMGTKVGYEVGYSIRFEDCTSDKTVLKYMTDGMLLREFLTEPSLEGYSSLIIDEAHERTLSTDILFALVKDIARFRPELRLLISSATMDAEKFSSYFDDAPVFYVPGRRYPVDIHYTPQPEANYLHAAITTVFQIHTTQPKGDILVFFTGQDEIEAAQESLQETARALGNKVAELIVCPIYANLPSEMQAKIFEPTPEGARKVVLATNIAETSITIDGVVFVIDPGFVKQNSYNPRTGMSSLTVVPCSRASANQRAGRAGRVGPGKAFRLYTKWAYSNELDENTVPEIQRTNLGMVVLLLKSLGINDLIGFEFMDPPPGETLMRALELLWTYENFLQFKSLSRVRDIRDQLAKLCDRTEVQIISNPNSNDISPIQKAITAGYFYNTATLQKSGDSYRTTKSKQTVYIHPSSSLFQHQPPVKTVLYYELMLTSKSYLRQVMEIKPVWLLEVAPHYFKREDLEEATSGEKKMPKVVGSSGRS